jgi:pyruvate carboxylase
VACSRPSPAIRSRRARRDGGYAGYQTSFSFDPLLAKVIGHVPGSFADAAALTWRALREFNIAGVRTNIGLLQNVLRHPDFVAGRIHTRFIEDHSTSSGRRGGRTGRCVRTIGEAIRVGARWTP